MSPDRDVWPAPKARDVSLGSPVARDTLDEAPTGTGDEVGRYVADVEGVIVSVVGVDVGTTGRMPECIARGPEPVSGAGTGTAEAAISPVPVDVDFSLARVGFFTSRLLELTAFLGFVV